MDDPYGFYKDKPQIVVCCETCSHRTTEFAESCKKGRDGDRHDHYFCPCWNLSKKAKELAFVQYAHGKGLDPWQITKQEGEWRVPKAAQPAAADGNEDVKGE